MPRTGQRTGSLSRVPGVLLDMARSRRMHPPLAAWFKERQDTRRRLEAVPTGISAGTSDLLADRVGFVQHQNRLVVNDLLEALDQPSPDPHPENSGRAVIVPGLDVPGLVREADARRISTSVHHQGVSVWTPFDVAPGWVSGEELACRVLTVQAPDVSSPIDAVITWVDASDKRWIESRDEWQSAATSPDGAEAARFRNRDELRYVLRSIDAYAPWIRTVYLVTASQKPHWHSETDRLAIVDHSEILDGSDLPTFNSHAIETAIHNIAGLAEHFVYFNDDSFVGRPISASHFFSSLGQPIYATAQPPLPPQGSDIVSQASLNSTSLLGIDEHLAPAKLNHAPRPLLRSTMAEAEERFSAAFRLTRTHKFRSSSDINPVSYLVPYFELERGTAELQVRDENYINIASRWAPSQMRALLNQRTAQTFTLNETYLPQRRARKVARTVTAFLEHYFPGTSRFER